MYKVVFGLILIYIFSSCEKSTDIHFNVKNLSNSEIIISGTDLIHNWTINDTIDVGEEKTITMWSKWGKDLNYFSPINFFGDDLLIINAQSDTIIKDYKDLDNWQIIIDEERAVATHHYLFEIQETDFN